MHQLSTKSAQKTKDLVHFPEGYTISDPEWMPTVLLMAKGRETVHVRSTELSY